MNPDQRLLVIGIYINGALYLTGVFVASLFVQHGGAWKWALGAAGASFLSYVAQVTAKPQHDLFVRKMLVILSKTAGLVAGILVLLGG